MPGKSKKYSFGKANKSTEITLPTSTPDEAHVVRVRIPDPAAMVKMGLLDDMNSLSSLVGLKIGEIEASGKPSPSQAEEIKNLAGNMDKLQKGLDLIDKLVEWMLVEPKALRPVVRDDKGKPVLVDDGKGNFVEVHLEDDDRDPDQDYTDDIPMENRLFIMQYAVGGTKDLEAFREGTAKIVDAVAAVPELPLSTIKTPKGKR